VWACPEGRFGQGRWPEEAIFVFKQPGGDQPASARLLRRVVEGVAGALCRWAQDLSLALFADIAILEVVMRSAIAREISQTYGPPGTPGTIYSGGEQLIAWPARHSTDCSTAARGICGESASA
jgi:hypothetical protein